MVRPARQLCPVCAHDEVVVLRVEDDWLMTCEDGCHPLYEWEPKQRRSSLDTYRNGLGQELGVYDTLMVCVVGGMAEYGVIEHRFAKRDRVTYDLLVGRYGHTTFGRTRYSASAFLGGALGQLWREELIDGVWGSATGYWSYNSQVGAYGPAGTSENAEILSWEAFATETLGVDPYDWPALGYRNETT